MARHFFSDDYTITDDSLNMALLHGGSSVVSDIAVTGVISTDSTTRITDDDGSQKGAVYVEEDMSRSEILADIKHNVEIASAGLLSSDSSSGKRWCDGTSSPFTADQSFLD